MGKITESSVQAFKSRKQFKHGNTAVHVSSDQVCYLLHSHTIAKIEGTKLKLSHCGFNTRTTSDRLNYIVQKFGIGRCFICDGMIFLDAGEKFHGSFNLHGTITFDMKTGEIEGNKNAL